jgi:hypothetical protein
MHNQLDQPGEDALGELAREQVDLLELLWEPPLASLAIAGVEHPIGELTPLQVADLMVYSEHCTSYGRSIRQGDRLLQSGDLLPMRALQHLLRAGDPHVDFSMVRTHVEPEHIVAASKEMVYQAVAQAKADPSLVAGPNEANRTTVLTSDFAGREKHAA